MQTILTKEDLLDFKQDLLNEIQTLISKTPQDKRWLKSTDVRRMLGISAGTLQTMRINGTIPYSKVGGTLYYNADDVERLFKSNRADLQSGTRHLRNSNTN